MAFFTLRRRHNLTPASDVCKAALRSLFRTLNELNELPDLFGLYVLFSQFKPRDVLKGICILSFRKLYVHKDVNKTKVSYAVSQMDVTRGLVSSVTQSSHVTLANVF